MERSVVPAATNVRVVSRQPTIRSERGKCVISGHEQIATINGSPTFSATKYAINPGLSDYTWLQTQAKGWEKYKFRHLQWVYVPAEAVTTTPGSVYICADYDPDDAAPETLPALSTYETQSNGRVFECVSLDLSVNRMFDGIQAKKIRCGPVGGDLQLYDAASVSVATISCSNTDPIGQLWVYYEVELISRQTEVTVKVPHNLVAYNLSSDQTLSTSSTSFVAWDEALNSGFDVTNTSGTLTLPCGSYMISGEIAITDSAAETCQALMSCLVDLAATVPPQNSEFDLAFGAGDTNTLPFTYFVTSSDSFTFRNQLTLYGAAGTLKVKGDKSRLFIRAL
jgi:hypothetical protein